VLFIPACAGPAAGGSRPAPGQWLLKNARQEIAQRREMRADYNCPKQLPQKGNATSTGGIDMCDNQDLDAMTENLTRSEFTRRQFAALSIGAGLAAATARAANAMDVVESDIDIKTPDGIADSYFVHPAKGKYPAVLVWTDIFGLRPAFKQMGKRLAEQGYSVLVPNPFYRTKRAPVVPAGVTMADPAGREMIMANGRSLNATTNVTDAHAFIAWLDTQAAVNTQRRIGTTGYCMGGSMVLRTAAELPNRVGAGATFHGGNGMATDKPDSPHLLIPKMKGRFLMALAETDDAQDPKVKTMLSAAFASAKLKVEVEVYKAKHGWCPPDSMVYDEKESERAWVRLLALFKAGLA
jgi:carboxymethylenebutenolidase